MPAQLNSVVQHLRRIVLLHDGAGLSDEHLLEMFISQKDQAAFEALVRRYAPMVMKVCRRVLGNHHDAEDVLQTTFLVLARKASSIRQREMLANWLHGVAFKTAWNARKLRMRRCGWERSVAQMPEAVQPNSSGSDLYSVLDQEVNRLADVYRLPILLCDLEGKSIKKVAQDLGWPQGTVAGRLARGRKLLAKRLTRHGLAMTGGAVFLQNAASASVSPFLVSSMVKAASAIISGKTAGTGLISANVAVLMKGALSSMFITKIKIATAVLVVGSIVALGGGMVLNGTAGGQQIEGGQVGGQKPAIRQVAQETERTAAGNKETASARTVHDKLRGTWKVIERNSGGKKQGTFPQATETWWIGKNKIVVKVAEESKNIRQEMTYHFWGDSDDAAPAPNNINIIGDYVNSEPHAPSRATSRGIFAVEGDKLTLCVRERVLGERPTAIPASPSKEDNLAIIVLQRESGVPKTDEERLQGEWQVVGGEENGEKYEPDDVLERFRFSFVGDVMIVAFEEEQEVVFKLDSATSPKQIDVTYKSQNMERKRIYIYALDGDDLKICFQRGEKEGTRPDSFTTTKGSGRETYILKRLKSTREGTTSSKGRDREDAKDDEPAQKEEGKKNEKADVRKKDADAAKTTHEKLRGTWRVVSMAARGGRSFPKDMNWTFWDEKIDMSPVVFRFEHLSLFDRVGRGRLQVAYQLGRDKRDIVEKTDAPNAINLTVPVTVAEPAGGVRNAIMWLRGIFALDKDRLILCGRLSNKNQDRPTEIPNLPGKDSDLWVIVLEREQMPKSVATDPAYSFDMAKLQGVWKFVVQQQAGREEAEIPTSHKTALTFDGEKVIMSAPDLTTSWPFKLDPIKKQLKITFNEQAATYSYRFEGEGLMLSYKTKDGWIMQKYEWEKTLAKSGIRNEKAKGIKDDAKRIEDTICERLKSKGYLEYDTAKCEIWVEKIDDGRLIHPTIVTRKNPEGEKSLIQADEAEIKVDLEDRKLLIIMSNGRAMSPNGRRVVFESYTWAIPLRSIEDAP